MPALRNPKKWKKYVRRTSEGKAKVVFDRNQASSPDWRVQAGDAILKMAKEAMDPKQPGFNRETEEQQKKVERGMAKGLQKHPLNKHKMHLRQAGLAGERVINSIITDTALRQTKAHTVIPAKDFVKLKAALFRVLNIELERRQIEIKTEKKYPNGIPENVFRQLRNYEFIRFMPAREAIENICKKHLGQIEGDKLANTIFETTEALIEAKNQIRFKELSNIENPRKKPNSKKKEGN